MSTQGSFLKSVVHPTITMRATPRFDSRDIPSSDGESEDCPACSEEQDEGGRTEIGRPNAVGQPFALFEHEDQNENRKANQRNHTNEKRDASGTARVVNVDRQVTRRAAVPIENTCSTCKAG